jgi:hypothetical protein
MLASVTAISAPRAARRLGSRLLDAWLCVIAISDYPHFVENACIGSRFLRGWQRDATQPFGGRKLCVDLGMAAASVVVCATVRHDPAHSSQEETP